MDQNVQRLLNDKLYDKRKQGALDLERIVREAIANRDGDRIQKIVDQLCHDYAYAVYQPHARNGGLIGLAAASIALGSEEVAPYLQEIVPPVLACFTDQDARVRYYACESMYNIAKVAKGELLLFFNDIFDALSKLASDSELSVKNGAELLDRLVKDIVSESAATYVSILQIPEKQASEGDPNAETDNASAELPMAFSLAKFIPLLQERIHVISPFTRMFLVSWLTLLDTIPDLELVFYLPAFLGGLIKFLGDQNRDVQVATQNILERFLAEIKKISRIKKGIEESRKSRDSGNVKPEITSDNASVETDQEFANDHSENAVADSDSVTANDDHGFPTDGDWVPGQDVHVDHPKILDILVGFVDTTFDEAMQLTALRWIDTFFEISPEDILPFVPRLLSQVLPAMSSGSDEVRQAANRVNNSLMAYIVSLSEDSLPEEPRPLPPSRVSTGGKEPAPRNSTSSGRPGQGGDSINDEKRQQGSRPDSRVDLTPRSSVAPTPQPPSDLDYAAAVNALTLQFLNENEATRVAALGWLIMLHRKAPRRVLAFNDGTFPALLKTLSDPAEAVVTRDLQLLSQISRNSDDSYFTSFMVNLLQLFSTDRKLLEIRGNLIIRQLSMNLSPERIYRNLADCLEKEEDLEFASIMVQNLNNNLITAPELADLRKRLRNLESRDGQLFFVALFRSWCHNAVATFSLCLLAQAYEQAYNLLQIFAELEMTVNMLIQIDKLVQLLESPVFTYLRLQLLEPEKYPYLYKCLYGVLMLLPQSSAFAALKNRLNSVSAIGLLHAGPRAYVSPKNTPSSSSSFDHHSRKRSTETHAPSGFSSPITSSSTAQGYERPTGRLKTREENVIRWVELLEKFKSVQEKARKAQLNARGQLDDDRNHSHHPSIGVALAAAGAAQNNGKDSRELPRMGGAGNGGGAAGAAGESGIAGAQKPTPQPPVQKSKSGLGNFGRLTGGIGQRKSKR
ncbi:hypothetical protein FQN54_004680 [Arachnomyces sp. PD_36]|nr:hypothetical protein FQN54_004680 [Arachnomyces sp. PD_36]